MPLNILLLLVVVGIAAIAALLHLLGKSNRPVLTPDRARDAWLRHYPEDTVTDVHVAQAGYAALIDTSAGEGLVWTMGVDTVARRLQDVRIDDKDTHLRVRFPDFAAPQVRLALTAEEKPLWKSRMMHP